MKITHTVSTVLLTGGLLVGSVINSQAQIIENYQTDGSSQSTFDSYIAPNLIQAGQSSLGSARADTSAISATFKASGLNDGSAVGSANKTYYEAIAGNGTIMPNTAVFQLTAGYNITNIQVISGWTDHNLAEQTFQVLLSIGNGPFTSIGTFTNNTSIAPGNSGPGAWMTTLTDGSGTIATNVTGIKFIFLNPDTSNGSGHVGTSQAGTGSKGGTVIHEVQVFGTYYAALTPAITASNQVSSGSASAFDGSIAPNLIRAGQGSLASATADTTALTSAGFSSAGLNDGSAAGNGNVTYYEVGSQNGTFMPNTAIFQLTAGYNITNIQVISGWANSGLGEQAFQVLVSIGGGAFTDLGTFINNTPAAGGNGSWLTTLTASTRTIATNVTAIKFIFVNPDATNGMQSVGTSQTGSGGTVVHEVQVFGTYYTNLPAAINLANIVQVNQTNGSSQSTFDSFIAPNLIQAGQGSLASATVDDSALNAAFSPAGLNDGSAAGSANLTYYSATAGNGTLMPSTAIFQLTAGYNITNIQVISGWSDHNLGEQAFQVLLSIGGGAFTSIGTFANNANLGSGNASWLTTLTASTGVIATNVTAIEFIFLNPDTSKGTGNVGTSQAGGASTGGTVIHEVQVFGTLDSATPVPPILGTPTALNGNLILTGTGGTPSASYTWLTTTNLSAPINWTTNSTGTLDGTGSFSNAIPIDAAQPASFFRLRLP